MSLIAGTKLGPYTILAPLGEGGMGEVYRATDTHLGREVAIKVLPEAFALDAERVARFEREARTLASVNHPHIAQVYGLEKNIVGGETALALVMELVEGPTLADRLTGGPLALDEAIPIARQIAEALEAAHDQGIVHRDLKPANIKVRSDGTVKVLDFGLAKPGAANAPTSIGLSAEARSQARAKADAPNSPTITSPVALSMGGMILGTAGYMSPEQARGRPVDRRADIWAFGCVLYEMLAGLRAFPGDDISDVLVAVIRDEPAWQALPDETPAAIATLLKRCLQKDPQKRLPHIGVARLELSEPVEAVSVNRPATPGRTGVGQRIAWAAAGAVVALAAVAAISVLRSTATPPTPRPTIRFEIQPTDGRAFPGAQGAPRFAVSPDGQAVAYQASIDGRSTALWIRRFDNSVAQPLLATESTAELGVQQPFWSPDGSSVAYFDEPAGQVKLVNLATSGVQVICEFSGNQMAGSWSDDGVIVFSSSRTGGIQRVSPSGGTPVQVTIVDTGRKEQAHLFPEFLPDGRHVIYLATGETSALYVAPLDGGPPKRILETRHMARLARPNRLLYVREDDLVWQRFDMDRLELVGEPTLVVGDIRRTAAGRVAVSTSTSGVLVYAAGTEGDDVEAIWVDRAGRTLDLPAIPGTRLGLRLSPDGRMLAYAQLRSQEDELWLYDVARQIPTRLGLLGASLASTFSPDGTRLVYRGPDRDGRPVLMEQLVSGAAPAAPIFVGELAETITAHDWSPDGSALIIGSSAFGRRSLHRLPMSGDRKKLPLLADGADRFQSSISPDGRWFIYTSNESGPPQVFMQPFPDPSGGKWPVSRPGAALARWRRDGREVFFIMDNQALMAAPVTLGSRPEIGPATKLFDLPPLGLNANAFGYPYDASPDGQRFIVLRARAGGGVTPLSVVVNWSP